jgi:peptidoglycan/xylan/chitin deacetylase (PgdA/CDA1 family)
MKNRDAVRGAGDNTPTTIRISRQDATTPMDAIRSFVKEMGAAIWWLKRHSSKPKLIVLTYHRVLKPGPQDLVEPGMYVEPETLREHLTFLADEVGLVSLEDWTQRAALARPLPRLAVAVTFDDGWFDNYQNAFPVLKALGVPATIFVVPNKVGKSDLFWPDRLARILVSLEQRPLSDEAARALRCELGVEQLPKNPEDFTRTVAFLKRYPDREVEERLVRAESVGVVDAYADQSLFMTWPQICEMARSSLVKFGSHGLNHLRLDASLTEAELIEEILDSKARLTDCVGEDVALFCYPNGEYSSHALDLVRRHYSAAVSTRTGWHAVGRDPHRIPRINLHQQKSGSIGRLRVALSGFVQ